jgi:hypothetical protein
MLKSNNLTFSHLVFFNVIFFLLFLVCLSPAAGQTLQVIIQPQEALDAGAQWQIVGEGLWYNSGEVAEVALGPVEIEFKSLPGWTRPVNQTINIAVNQPYVTTGIYQPLTGSLQVFIQPQEAVDAGAQWQIVGEGLWRSSGEVVEVALGPVEIKFKALPGWTKPPNQTISIITNQLYTATGIYQLLTGSLQVFIQPQEAVDAGAQWQIVGEALWYDSGEVAEVALGPVEIEFKALPGWTKPSNQTISIAAAQSYTATGMYIRRKGQLTITLHPSNVAGVAKWRIRELSLVNWYTSGHTLQIPYGTWTVEFRNMRGYIRPNSRSIKISSSAPKNIAVTYDRLLLGRIRIIANTTIKNGNNFMAIGNVRLAFKRLAGGYTQEIISINSPLSGTLSPPIINGKGAISVCRSAHSLPLFSMGAFYTGSFSMNAETLEIRNLNFRAGVKFMGFAFDIKKFVFSPDPFYISMEVELVLPSSIFGGGGYVHLNRFTLQNGQPPVVIGRARLYDCNVFDWIVIEDTFLDIDTTTNSFWINAGLIKLDDILPPFTGIFRLENGKLAQLKLAVYDADLQFLKTVPLYLQDIGFDLRNPSSKLGQIQTNIRFTVLPNDIALAEQEGNLLIGFNGEIQGTLRSHALLGFKSSTSNIHFIPSRSLQNSFSGNYVWGLLRISGATTVIWKPNFAFSGNGSGTVGFSVPKWARIFVKKLMVGDYLYIANATAAISRSGFDASAKFLNFIPLKVHFDPAKSTKDIGHIESTTLPVEVRTYNGGFAPEGNTYVVKENNPAVIFTGIGELNTPHMVLIQPDGKIFDPSGVLPSEGRNFKYRRDDEEKSSSFLIGKPLAGAWTVSIKNPAEAGKTDVYFVKANSEPRIILGNAEKIAENYYRVYLKAYDPDNKAKVTLFWDSDNKDFNGISVASAVEQDGPLTVDWEPTDTLWNSGYLYVEIDDGRNPPVRTYFNENIILERSSIPSPLFRSRKVVDDALVINVKLENPAQLTALKVYYSRDLETEVLTSYAIAPVDSQIKLKEGPIKPGRIYQLGVAALDDLGRETEISSRKKIKYVAQKGNNFPYFKSEPILEAEAGKEYVYAFSAIDWDNDPLTYMLESAPEGVILDNINQTLSWMPTNEDAGDNFIVLTVSDGQGGSDEQVYTLKVSAEGTPIVDAETAFIRYESGPVFQVRVIDHLADIDSAVQDELKVKIVDTDGYEEWELMLYETSANSGVFFRNIDLNDTLMPVPYWLLNRSIHNFEYGLVVNWSPREGKNRKIKTVLD